MRPIKDEETFQDFIEPEMQIKPEDIPEEFKQRLLSFVPPPVLAIEDKRVPVETECTVVDKDLPVHICADCSRVDEQPECHGEQIKFFEENPAAAVLECSNFARVAGDGEEIQNGKNATKQGKKSRKPKKASNKKNRG